MINHCLNSDTIAAIPFNLGSVPAICLPATLENAARRLLVPAVFQKSKRA
jgi:hypothetical protein